MYAKLIITLLYKDFGDDEISVDFSMQILNLIAKCAPLCTFII